MNVIITGGSRGIGKAIAMQFAAAGHTILLGAGNEASLHTTAAEIRAAWPACTVHTRKADLSIKAQAQAFGNWCLEWGTPGVLVNNAGRFLPGSIHNEEEDTLEKMIETNLYSAYYVTRALLPAMVVQKSGHIFNMCSIASLQAYANGGSYSISKFALLGFSKNLREELKPYNIKVTGILPGAAYTDSWKDSGVDPQRIMEAEDVAKMVFAASLLSPQAVVEDIVLRPQLGDL
ncbi:short-chain dehydrogenase/reductase SDR [Russula earlei]|uniref:Short-chain dehydrogenase/reductase SDR n=1 Tax=Russula earlei TaxID=71964 RepID=A0ACC0TS70_9AGAM|nr:short-chain dehydrogenase/reductase SDR [Russula earlei]